MAAVRDGDHFVLDGQKTWTTAAHLAAHVLVLVRTDPTRPEQDGLTLLRTATAKAADVLGIGSTTGRVDPGLSADLLVVDGDPRDDLQTVRRPRIVVARGQRAN